MEYKDGIVKANTYDIEAIKDYVKKLRKDGVKVKSLFLAIYNDDNKYDKDYSKLKKLGIHVDIKYACPGSTIGYYCSLDEFLKYQGRINKIRKQLIDNGLTTFEKLVKTIRFLETIPFNLPDYSKGVCYTFPHIILEKGLIVCEGYCLLMQEILYGVDDISIDRLSASFYDENGNFLDYHAVNLIDIKDSKYNVDGVYISDITNDTFLESDKEAFGDDYNPGDKFEHFLRPLTDWELYDQDNLRLYIGTYDQIMNEKLYEIDQAEMFRDILNNDNSRYDVHEIKVLSSELNLEGKSYNELKRIIDSPKIEFETLLQAIANIRREEGMDEKHIKQEIDKINRIHQFCVDFRKEYVYKK